MLLLSPEHEHEIRAHAESDYPYECCGVLLGSVEGDVQRCSGVRRLTNVHEEGHERRYLVSPDEMFALQREERKTGIKVLGFYHSHPDHPARPSQYDSDWAMPWYAYIIVAVANGTSEALTCWRLNDETHVLEPYEPGAAEAQRKTTE